MEGCESQVCELRRGELGDQAVRKDSGMAHGFQKAGRVRNNVFVFLEPLKFLVNSVVGLTNLQVTCRQMGLLICIFL